MKRYVIYNILTGYYFDNDFVEAKIDDCRMFDTLEDAELFLSEYLTNKVVFYRIDAIYIKF